METPVLRVCSFSEYFLCFFTVHLFFSCLFDSSFVYEYHFLSAYDINCKFNWDFEQYWNLPPSRMCL